MLRSHRHGRWTAEDAIDRQHCAELLSQAAAGCGLPAPFDDILCLYEGCLAERGCAAPQLREGLFSRGWRRLTSWWRGRRIVPNSGEDLGGGGRSRPPDLPVRRVPA